MRFLFSFCAALLLLGSIGVGAAPGPRQHLLMDADWRFTRDLAYNLAHPIALNTWRWTESDNEATDAQALSSPAYDDSAAPWQTAAPGDDVFKGRIGYAWFRDVVPATVKISGSRPMLFIQADDNADIYLNGVHLAHHEGWDQSFTVPLASAWKANGPNVLLALVQNTAGGGGLIGPVMLGGYAAPIEPLSLSYNDSSWRTVHLPDDYIVRGTFTPTADASHGSLPVYPAWYRKTFSLPAADKGKDLWVTFDGVYRDAKVWLNGIFLGEHQSGYIGFRYDISRAARCGAKNILVVHVDPTKPEGWWYEGGGIYRHVWLNAASPLHVAPWGTFVTSNVRNVLTHPSASLQVQTTFANTGATAPCRVLSQIFDPSGKEVGSAESEITVPAGGAPTLNQTVSLAHASLWSLDRPNMYSLRTQLLQNGKAIDDYVTPFGIRTLRFDPQTGFYLNDKPVKIQGVCNHQDFAGVGIGVPDTLEYWRVAQLKKMGANGWRMSHNPPTPSLLDACDREGMVVMDENRHLGDTYDAKTPSGTGYSDLSDLRDMILRDRNHPSIIMWSMCNEEPLEYTPEGAKIFQAMMNKVHQYDTSRPITCAMNGGWLNAGFATVEDLVGINYSTGVYDQVHARYPNKMIYGSETGSTVSTRGIYALQPFSNGSGSFFGDPTMGWVSAYDINAPNWAQTAEAAWSSLATRPFMAGGFNWTGFDYKGEPTPFGWPDINSNFGLIDEAGFPKDLYYYYQAWWTDQPVVHILPHWNWPGKEGQPIPVWVFSNAASVELFLNGKSLGRQTMPRYGHDQWSVPYAPGTLLAKGYDASGKLMGSDTVQTTGAPAALRLSTDRTTLSADGEDVTVVDVAVVDSLGRVVPTAGNLVHFAVTGAGRIAGVGNGNPSDHDPDQVPFRLAFNGRCAVVVGAVSRPGAIHLTATSAGLKPAQMLLHAEQTAPTEGY